MCIREGKKREKREKRGHWLTSSEGVSHVIGHSIAAH